MLPDLARDLLTPTPPRTLTSVPGVDCLSDLSSESEHSSPESNTPDEADLNAVGRDVGLLDVSVSTSKPCHGSRHPPTTASSVEQDKDRREDQVRVESKTANDEVEDNDLHNL